jgi:Ca2+-binding RTX toxin-like protein
MSVFRTTSVAVGLLVGIAILVAPRSAAAAPSCAEGPVTVGDVTVGTPCADFIVASPGVAVVRGGGGDDTIVAGPISAGAECTGVCAHLGVGSQTFEGGPGNDVVFGERGNDTLNGGGGDDSLYGGIGDDLLRGGTGNDLLAGGFGFDVVDGEEGDDFVRGDGTIDEIFNGGGGIDTLSYATGVTPGFTRSPGSYTNFPPASGERGVYVDLSSGLGDNGVATAGGGVDEIKGGGFEKVIGTPFSDVIIGTTGAAETIYGGGGADVLLGKGGGDVVYGGADGDSCEGTTTVGCEGSGNTVAPRDPSKVAVGQMAPQEGVEPGLYLAGSEGADAVSASYDAGSLTVEFTLGAGSEFDSASTSAGACEAPTAQEARCQVGETPDAIVLAGLGGNDTLEANGFPSQTSVVLLGGDGNDSLEGGELSEDVLVDGPGNDRLEALGGDDAVLDNGGVDQLFGGEGNDLSLSNSICDGDLYDAGGGRDNASWSKFGSPVEARLDTGFVGSPGSAGPICSGGSPNRLENVEDLEGSGNGDFLYGDSGPNQLLGRSGADSYFAAAGDDSILANSGDTDLVIDCGEGFDSALIDPPPIDPEPVGCESVNGAEANSFEPPSPPPPLPDLTPPVTRILRRPPPVVFTRSRRRTVAFSFASNEPGSTFRCRLDRAGFKSCRAPRRYTVELGRHVVRIYAIDAAGNRDRSPAVVMFRVRRR